MSKINTFRAVNLNYNNNANRIEDETFHFEGDHTLLSLQNGGGKTVLVQMMLAPFVHKRFRDTADRPFSGYFTSNRPTFLLVEWQLDGGAGYVLTGMMVRKRQADANEESAEELEVINFIHEYQQPNPFDIHQLPIVEYEGRQKKLKGFHVCRKLFDEIRSEVGVKFQAFDMNQANQQRQYFIRLKEYGIHPDEWETIIKKINLKESGLSELFKEAKDEVGLVEKWFLPAIETKLNKDENRVKQFRNMLIKFIRLYKENEVKIKRKGTILEFQQDGRRIKESASESLELSRQVQMKQAELAFLRDCIGKLLDVTLEKEENTREVVHSYEEQLEQVHYEEASYQIYQLMDHLEQLTYEQNRIADELMIQQEQYAQVEKQSKIQQCAKAYEDYLEEEQSVLDLEYQYEALKKKVEDVAPRRDNLGYNLKLIYSEKIRKIKDEIVCVTEEINHLNREQSELQGAEREEEKQRSALREETGSKKAELIQYQESEQDFNRNYTLKLERNILGTYEDGTFDLLEKQLRQKADQNSHKLISIYTNKQKCEEKRESIQRDIQDCNHLTGELNVIKMNLQDTGKRYQDEMDARLRYMKYLSLPEDKKYDREFICNAFDQKTGALRDVLKKIEREKETTETGIHKMKRGIVLEIPDEFGQLLHSLDINYVQGMEYLKNSGYTNKQTDELLDKVPLLPFSLIMSERELNKLAKATVDFYTSFPIPIVIKEQLNLFPEREYNGIYQGERFNFFVLFNRQLLNEAELELLIQKEESQLASVIEKLNRKEDEIKYYDEMRQEIFYQNITLEKYQKFQKDTNECNNRIEESENRMIQLRTENEENEKFIESQEKLIRECENEKQVLESLQTAIAEMRRKYEHYLENRKRIEQLNKKLEQLSGESATRKTRIDEIYRLLSSSMLQSNNLEIEFKQNSEQYTKYAQFQSGTILNKDISDLEAEYKAITETMDGDVKLVEKQLDQARKRFSKVQDNLIGLTRKNQIDENQYKTVRFSRIQSDELELQLKKQSERIEAVKKQWSTIDKQVGICESRISDKKSELCNRFETEEFVPKEQIINISFKTREKLLGYSIQEENKILRSLEERKVGYQANISALSEFSSYSFDDSTTISSELEKYHKNSLEELSRKEMEEMYGHMIRDCRELSEKLRRQKLVLDRILEELKRDIRYMEDFFSQPVELMRNLTENPDNLLKQLEITLQSYQTLLDKLEVDISFIDREKQKIVEMLLDYVLEIHKNLEKIDRNSNIIIRERSVKMLRIQVPVWDENKEIYLQRTATFVGELISAGLQCITDNQNLDEMTGARVTSKNLYDSVVGVGSTTIKLYKIESQREYPITWAQVSKNSGGEGFLSAFVILTCLLSYMRRDESDLFMEREEGKVIIMDNPFAQTNASHLLIPLMDVAKKYNTQLICLTGLGGESIYNRFDNIYVLNLVESGLQRDIQYLKAEHVKGDAKIYQLSTVRMQIEDAEQIELIF